MFMTVLGLLHAPNGRNDFDKQKHPLKSCLTWPHHHEPRVPCAITVPKAPDGNLKLSQHNITFISLYICSF